MLSETSAVGALSFYDHHRQSYGHMPISGKSDGVLRPVVQASRGLTVVVCTTMDCAATATTWVRLLDADAPEEDIAYCRECADSITKAKVGFLSHGPHDLPSDPIQQFLDDPGTVIAVEQFVEDKMREHQEPDGSYACDPHIMVRYCLEALRSEAPR